jgi:large subunit ribosomal protein L25
MAKTRKISAEIRRTASRGQLRALRKAGRVPGVVYGNNKSAENIVVDGIALGQELAEGAFLSRLIELEIDGAMERVLPREVQVDPISERPLHVDFLRVAADSRIRLAVPVIFRDTGASPGLKRGGVLNVVRREIELSCRADAIPEQIEVSVAGLDIGGSVHIGAVALPAGVEPVIKRDFTIATIAAPSVMVEVEVAKPAEAVEAAEAVAAEGAPAPAAAPEGAEAKAAPAEAKGKAPAEGKGKAPAEKAKK